jgi:hypothetical protein
MEFKAKKKVVDGKEILVIEPICEEIVYTDGSQSVVIHAPSLALISEFKAANGIA